MRRDVIDLGIDICRALEVCKKHNIIHRDIETDNKTIGIFPQQQSEDNRKKEEPIKKDRPQRSDPEKKQRRRSVKEKIINKRSAGVPGKICLILSCAVAGIYLFLPVFWNYFRGDFGNLFTELQYWIPRLPGTVYKPEQKVTALFVVIVPVLLSLIDMFLTIKHGNRSKKTVIIRTIIYAAAYLINAAYIEFGWVFENLASSPNYIFAMVLLLINLVMIVTITICGFKEIKQENE